MVAAGDFLRASDVLDRVGCRLRRVANQSIASATATAMSWDTEDEDTDGFIAVTATTVTIPTGLGGIYAITTHLSCGGITGTGGGVIINTTSAITGMPLDFLIPLDETRDRGGNTVVIPLLAADTFIVEAYHTTGSNVNFTGWLSCYRLGL